MRTEKFLRHPGDENTKRKVEPFEERTGYWRHCVAIVLIVLTVTVFQLAGELNAEIVYGHVYRPDGEMETSGQLVFGDSGQYQGTIENGNYRIFLPEGVYEVQLAGANCWAEVVSYLRPMRQDIHLECEGGGDHE